MNNSVGHYVGLVWHPASDENKPSWDEKFKEWQRLSRVGWLHMTSEDFKEVLQALTELLVRDAHWQKKWMAALDLLDAPHAELSEARATLVAFRETLTDARIVIESTAHGLAINRPGRTISTTVLLAQIDAALAAIAEIAPINLCPLCQEQMPCGCDGSRA